MGKEVKKAGKGAGGRKPAGKKVAEDGLTTKQRLFVEFYLGEAHFVGVEAARRAGYQGSYWTLAAVASENLKKPKIKKLVEGRIDEAAMPANEVLQRLSGHARASMADLLNVDGYFAFLDLKKAAENGSIRLIKKMKFNDFGGIESLELYDAQAALSLLGKHHRLFDRAGESVSVEEQARALYQEFVDPAGPYRMRPEEAAPIVVAEFGIPESALISEAVN